METYGPVYSHWAYAGVVGTELLVVKVEAIGQSIPETDSTEDYSSRTEPGLLQAAVDLLQERITQLENSKSS
jgi:hypothetical protein